MRLPAAGLTLAACGGGGTKAAKQANDTPNFELPAQISATTANRLDRIGPDITFAPVRAPGVWDTLVDRHGGHAAARMGAYEEAAGPGTGQGGSRGARHCRRSIHLACATRFYPGRSWPTAQPPSPGSPHERRCSGPWWAAACSLEIPVYPRSSARPVARSAVGTSAQTLPARANGLVGATVALLPSLRPLAAG
jgi:hypothetical protein